MENFSNLYCTTVYLPLGLSLVSRKGPNMPMPRAPTGAVSTMDKTAMVSTFKKCDSHKVILKD